MELGNASPPELYERLPLGYGGRFYGVYPAVVTDIKDPDGMGRVKLKLPWAPDTSDGVYDVWGRIATLMAGNARGTWFIPEPNDEVLVSFEGGDPRKPYVLGMLWNGVDVPNETMDGDGKNNIKSIKTRSGITITFDDTEDKPKLELKTPAEQSLAISDDGDNSTVVLKDKAGNTITMDKDGMIFKDKNGMTITQSSKGVEVKDPGTNAIIKLDGGKVEAADQGGDKFGMDGSGNISLQNAAGNSVKLAAASVDTAAGPGKVSVGTSGVTVESPPAKVALGPAGVTAESPPAKMGLAPAAASLEYAASSVKAGPAGVDVMGGPSILKVGLDGVNITALKVGITAPMVQITAAMTQVAGVVQCATLIASSVVSPTYTPGGGNMM